MRLWQVFPKGFRGGGGTESFQLIPVGTGGTNISVKLYEHCKAQGIALDWGIALVSQEEDAKKLREKEMDEDRIVLVNPRGEGFRRDIEFGCEKFKEKRKEIEDKVGKYLQEDTIFIIISGEGGGTSGAFWKSNVIEIFSHACTEGVYCFIIVSHEDADERITANEKEGFEEIQKISKEYDNVCSIMIVNPSNDFDECNKIIVDEIILPFLRCFRPDDIAEQGLKKDFLRRFVKLAVPATSSLRLNNVDGEKIKRLVERAAMSRFIGLQKIDEVKGCFNYIISVFQAPRNEIRSIGSKIKEEIRDIFDVKRVEFFGAPEEGIREATLLLLCLGQGDYDKHRKISVMRRIEKSQKIVKPDVFDPDEILNWKIKEGEYEGSREVSESGIERVRRRF